MQEKFPIALYCSEDYFGAFLKWVILLETNRVLTLSSLNPSLRL
jgi:hypothetical protein